MITTFGPLLLQILPFGGTNYILIFGYNAWPLVIRAPNAGLAPTAELQTNFQKTVHILLFVPKRGSHLTIEHLTLGHQLTQSVECSIKDIAPTQTALTGTSVFLSVKEITLGSPARQVSNNVQASV